MNPLPDFVIIGAMKSATSTLHDQLAEQPGIFMSTPKEPCYFSDEDQYTKGLDWYSSLFASADGQSLRGESSTHYTKLPDHPKTVERMLKTLPAIKLVYIMRQPIERLISHYMHEWTMSVYHCDIETAIERYPELIDYGRYSMQLEPYFEAYGRDAVCPVFFDRLVAYPQEELERICRFIGYAGSPQWKQALPPSNISSQRVRRFPMYELLYESGIATWLRRTLVPQGIRDMLKARLTMKNKPDLSPASRTRLEQVFDSDLAILGEWLGSELNCRNFKQVTTDLEPEWKS
jgi:hypothetical protein